MRKPEALQTDPTIAGIRRSRVQARRAARILGEQLVHKQLNQSGNLDSFTYIPSAQSPSYTLSYIIFISVHCRGGWEGPGKGENRLTLMATTLKSHYALSTIRTCSSLDHLISLLHSLFFFLSFRSSSC